MNIPTLSYSVTSTRGTGGWHGLNTVTVQKLSVKRSLFGSRIVHTKLKTHDVRWSHGATPARASELYQAYLSCVAAFERYDFMPGHLVDQLWKINQRANILLEAFGTTAGTDDELDRVYYSAACTAYQIIEDYKNLEHLVSREARETPGNEISHQQRAIASIEATRKVEDKMFSEIHDEYQNTIRELSSPRL